MASAFIDAGRSRRNRLRPIGPRPGGIVTVGGGDAERRDRQALSVRPARSTGVLAGDVPAPAPADPGQGLGGDHGRDRGHRDAAGGTPRARACCSSRITAGCATRLAVTVLGARRAPRSTRWRAGTSSWAGATRRGSRGGSARSACTGRGSIARRSGRPSSCWSRRAGRSSSSRRDPHALQRPARRAPRGAGLHRPFRGETTRKIEPGARTLVIPVALRYRFLGRLDESAAPSSIGSRPD